MRDAGCAGVRGGSPLRVDESHLPHVSELVLDDERIERLPRRPPLLHEGEPARPVAPLGERLRRDRSDAGQCPCAGGAGVERAGLDGDPELVALRIPRDDRVGQAATLARVGGHRTGSRRPGNPTPRATLEGWTARIAVADDESLVRACVPRPDSCAGARVAGDRNRGARPRAGADGLGQDARRLPAGDRPAEQNARRRAPAALRLAAQSAQLRRRAEPPRAARRARLAAHGRRPYRRHAAARPAADAADAARRPHHDPRVAVPSPHLAGAGDARGASRR